MLTLTPSFLSAHPGSCIGALALDINGCTFDAPAFASARDIFTEKLGSRYAGWARPQLIELPVMAAYRAYYKKYQKTYHVLQQIESIVQKGKPLPEGNPLVEAAFMAELDTLILTASHDLDLLQPPFRMDAATGDEQFIQRTGAEQAQKPGDMLMRDATGVVCSVLYGQDNRSFVTPVTQRVLYVAYVPAGIGKPPVQTHLAHLAALATLAYPGVSVLYHAVLP